MSRVIKASRIKGEYKIKDKKIEIKKSSAEKNKITNNDTYSGKRKIDMDEKEYSELKSLKEEIIDKAHREAEAIQEKARESAENFKEEARLEAEKIREKAREEGYDEGLASGKEEGREKVREEFKDLTDNFESIISKARSSLDNKLELFQKQIIELALKIAEKMVVSALEINPELINNIILDILEKMTEFEKVNIHVHPRLEKYLLKEEFSSKFVRQKINFIADIKLKIGDCIVETPLGGKDASFENKLDLIEKELLKGVSMDEGA